MPGRLGLRDRILVWYGGTVFAVLALVLLSVHVEVGRETNRLVAVQMDATRQVIVSLTEERTATLSLLARSAGQEPLVGAVMAADSATITDVLTRDLNPSLEADFIRVTDRWGRVRADTSGRTKPGADLSQDEAVRAALAGKGWRGTLIIPGEIDLVASAPIHVGGQDLGTITIGRRVSDEMAAQLFRSTGSKVTLFAGGQVAASTWPAAVRPALLCALQEALPGSLRPGRLPLAGRPLRFTMLFAGHHRICLLTSFPWQGGSSGRGHLLIQSNLDTALSPYTNIRRALAFIALMGFLVAALGSVIVAGGVTRPLHQIAGAVRGLTQGDWSHRAPVAARDEVGLLAETFNQMAERLASWDADLRTAVAGRTEDLNAALAQLDAAFQQMRQFNADVSHELRTPLTVIRGEAEVALRARRGAEEYEAVLHTIQDETERMSRIIEQLLLLARADSGELCVERRLLVLDDLVREVAHRAEVLARAQGLQLCTETPRPIVLEGDEDQLRRLVLNLVDNAIKYTPAGGQVRVRLDLLGSDAGGTGGEAVLEVEDTGIGIDAADQSRIFDRFYRVDKARSRAGCHAQRAPGVGSGLGLAICRWIVEAHEGRIEVRSTPGVGSCFTVRLAGARSPLLHPDDIDTTVPESREQPALSPVDGMQAAVGADLQES